jgi:ApbE superfamily uncharacterized protein (UPF0280 family)
LYQPRLYRDEMNSDRFRFFSSVHHESDLLVGVNFDSYQDNMEVVCREEQLRLYKLLSAHIVQFPSFASALNPLPIPGEAGLAPELKTMYKLAFVTGTGPMSSVAGLFAQGLGRVLGGEKKNSSVEVLVENGGDLYVRNQEDLVVVVQAGDVALSGKLGLVIPPGEWGICTSSGTLGHSYSKGKADALTIVCRDTPLADAWATALANQIEGKEDIRPLLKRVEGLTEILACVVIVDGELGILGNFETKLLSSGA